MNMIKRELRAAWISLIVWGLGFVFLAYAGIVKFDSIIGSGPQVVDLVDRLPRVVLALFNMADIDITHLADYYSIIASYLMVMVAAHGLFLGIRLFAKEEQAKTADFLLTKPRSRRTIYLQKVMAGVVILLILQLIMFLCNYAALANHLPDAMALLMNYSLAFLAIHLLFLGLGCLLVNVAPAKKAETIGLGILLISYFAPVLANMTEKRHHLSGYFPFNTFLDRSMAEAGGAPVGKLIFLGLLAVVFIWVGLQRFKTKDIYI
ncbi:MAG TPA: ABC transporter permease subunit [Tissierellia bacterium]|nr:ABC transporter permease subunit [Tissierellia bacterium]